MIVDEYLTHLHIKHDNKGSSLSTNEFYNAINFTFTNYTMNLEKMSKDCLDLAEKEKSVCMIKAKIHAKQEQLNTLKELKTNKINNESLNKTIKEVMNDLNMLQNKLK